MFSNKIYCELFYQNSNHLQQIYDGFEKLAISGIIKLKVNYSNKSDSPILKVRINNKFDVYYDLLDGFNWIDDTIDNNLNYFKNNLNSDFYFKRSFNNKLLEYNLKNRKIYPLGFNYYINPKGVFINKHYNNSFKSKLKQVVKQQFHSFQKNNRSKITSNYFENNPIFNKDNRILFSTRLWNPDETNQKHNKELREKINNQRIEYILACKKEFGKSFTGGLFDDEYTNKKAKSLILPTKVSNKKNYLDILKKHNICIATTGLHKSIGWKMGEYIAASRAIVSETLNYDVPGNFVNKKNYLEFDNSDNLLEKLEYLLSKPRETEQIMTNNYNYYKNYLHPEQLILNTLKIITQKG